MDRSRCEELSAVAAVRARHARLTTASQAASSTAGSSTGTSPSNAQNSQPRRNDYPQMGPHCLPARPEPPNVNRNVPLLPRLSLLHPPKRARIEDIDEEICDGEHSDGAALENCDSSSSGSDILHRRHTDVLSQIRLSALNVDESNANGLSVTLKPGQTLVLLGLYDLWVKKGAVSVLGAELTAGKSLYRVYAPSTHSLPEIAHQGTSEAQVGLISVRSGIRSLRELSPLFGRIWNDKRTSDNFSNPDDMKNRSFAVLYNSACDPKKRHLTKFMPGRTWPNWAANLSTPHDASPPRAMICGAKGTGKSTLGQFLINQFLTTSSGRRDSVAFLDLDPGQPQFSPPGQIGLAYFRSPVFGPSFSHPASPRDSVNRVIRAHHITSLRISDDEEYYMNCAEDLMSEYEALLEQDPACPLIVNMPGWVVGTGLETIKGLAAKLRITSLIYMDAPVKEGKTQLVAAARELNLRFWQADTVPLDGVTRTAKQFRAMQMMSYFHLAEPDVEHLQWHDTPLYMIRPWVLNYESGVQPFLAVMVVGGRPGSGALSKVVDGAIVGLVVLEDDSALIAPDIQDAIVTREATTISDATPAHGPDISALVTRDAATGLPILHVPPSSSIPLQASKSHTLGLALIRGIDVQSKKIQLLTPIPPSSIANVFRKSQKILLVRGTLDSLDWAYKEQSYALEAEERRLERRLRSREWANVKGIDPEETGQHLPWLTIEKGKARPKPDNSLKEEKRLATVMDYAMENAERNE